MFDGVTWDGGVFHSYLTNLRLNLILGGMRSGESPAWQYLAWFLIADSGLSVLCAAGAAIRPRRYGFLLALIVLVLVLHTLQSHKEYRFAFVVVPLWLLIGADLVARVSWCPAASRGWAGLAATVFVAVSLGGILNALPYQDRVYKAWSAESGYVAFLRNRDPVFAAYRYLAQAPEVGAVWHVERHYHQLPGYYYLHHEVPFYDSFTGRRILMDLPLPATVTHLVSSSPDLALPEYTVERTFGNIRILSRRATKRQIRRWQAYNPIVVSRTAVRIMPQIDAESPSPPGNWGIRFTDEGAPDERREGLPR